MCFGPVLRVGPAGGAQVAQVVAVPISGPVFGVLGVGDLVQRRKRGVSDAEARYP